MDNLDILFPSSLGSNKKIYVYWCGTFWMFIQSTPKFCVPLSKPDGYLEQVCRIQDTPHGFPVMGNIRRTLFLSLVLFGAACHVLMSVSSNMARPDKSFVTSTTNQMGNPMFPSQYWRSRLTVWAPFAFINNARPQESTRLNSYSYEIGFLKHAAVLAPLGGISISPADALLA